MTAQYAVAGAHESLVVGRTTPPMRSPGSSPKFGDGGADAVPRAGLAKRRVQAVCHGPSARRRPRRSRTSRRRIRRPGAGHAGRRGDRGLPR
ncbi:hypothetical protein [Streptomyces sp. NPDC015345]|uniref:hypothetical protein n=1 Tax=Streptomyces sp. NPDC015345 TaxID=3364953 RepID=UPI0036F9BFB1